MATPARRGHGEGSVYRDAANGTWVGAISLGWRPDGTRIRRKVTGRTKTEVRHAEVNDHVGRNVAAFVKPPQGKTGRPSRAMTGAEAAALLAAAKDHPRLGRRTQVNLDLARAYAMSRKDAAAVNLLLAAERLSPQLVRYDQATCDVLTELLRREHRPSTPELRPLARRAGVI